MKPAQNSILTIPNLLSLLRLLMIPVFITLYHQGYIYGTAFVLFLSGLTDVIDGWVARRFNQVSDFGKAFDPVADKLTQAAMLICLIKSHPTVVFPLVLLVIKEVFCGLTGLFVITYTGNVPMAKWHGKAATVLLYSMMILHLLWQEMPIWTSNIINAACAVMLIVSMLLYCRSNIIIIRNANRKSDMEAIDVSKAP